MRLHGYCLECHKIKRVQVSGSGMARIAAGGVPSGICSSCQQAEDDKRREAHEQRGGRR